MNWPIFLKRKQGRRVKNVSRPAPRPLRFIVDIRRIERRAESTTPFLAAQHESWKRKFSQTFFFLTNRRKFALVSGVMCVAVFFAALPARADIITFYPTSCLGGWVNPEHAQGQFSVLDRGDGEVIGDESFSRENSAVLEGSAAQIFCGSFNADVPEDATVSGFTLIFSWDFRNPKSGKSLPSPLSVDGTDYAFKQAAAVATAFYSGVHDATTTPAGTAFAHATATTTIVATDATSTANAILNLDTRQAAEVHIEFATTTAAQASENPVSTSTSVPESQPETNTASVKAALDESTPPPVPVESVPVTPPPAAGGDVVVPEPVTTPAPAPAEPSPAPEPAPQSFNPVLIFASLFATPVHAQEAEATPAAAPESAPAPAPAEPAPIAPASVESVPATPTPTPAAGEPVAPVVEPAAAEQKASVIEAVQPAEVVPTPEPAPVPASAPSGTAATPEATSTEPVITTNAVSTSTAPASTTDMTPAEQEKAILTELSTIQDAPFLEVLYSIDGTTWRQLGTVSAQNWKYSRFALPVTDWRDLERLQITVQTLPVTGTMPTVYLDGLAVEANVLYSRRDPNPIPDLLADTLIKQEVASSYRAALIRRVQDVGQTELWVSEVVDPKSLRVLSGKNALEAQLIQRALTSTSTSRFVRLSWRKVADTTLVGETTNLATYQRSLFWTDALANSVWKYSIDSNSYESVSIDPVSGQGEMEFSDEAGQVVRVTYNRDTKKFVFTLVADEGSDAK